MRILGALILAFTATITAAATERTTIVISDLHLGLGKNQPLEDFRWDPEFAEFLAAIRRAGRTTLILNGDTFELWQTGEPKCKLQDAGCDAEQTVAHLRQVLNAHQEAVTALRRFAEIPSNRLILVPGNHDAGILFHRAAEVLHETLPEAQIATEGYFATDDKLVYVTHGHQADPINAYEHWPNPFVEHHGTKHLQRPAGEAVVQRLINSLEASYPLIDNIRSDRDAVAMALAAEGSAATPALFRFVLFDTTPRQRITITLGPETGGQPNWNIAAIRREGDAFLIKGLPDPLREAVLKHRTPLMMHVTGDDELTDNELRELCNQRARRASPRNAMSVCPHSLGGAMSAIPDIATKAWESYLRSLGDPAARPILIVLSHTHDAEQPRDALPQARDWHPVTVNTGAWQRVVTRGQMRSLARDRGIADEFAALRQLTPDDLPACYTFVVIPPYEHVPVAALRAWRRVGSTWGESDGCGQ